MKKEKYQQIFNYLREFSKLRSNPVRDIDAHETQYPERFWLNDIPETVLFENVIRPDFNPENDFWIRVRKTKEPIKPTFAKLSKNLEKWIEPSSLLNVEEQPFLKVTIETNEGTLAIEDYPEITEELNWYINQKWIDDIIDFNSQKELYDKEYENYETLNNTYKLLFKIFNRTQQFGEEYELVIGVGLLNFKENTDRPKIFRHILTQRVDINFEYSQKDPQIIISPNLESVPQIETDAILDLFDQFDSQNIIDAEKAVEAFIIEKGIDTLFSDKIIEDALQMFAETVSPDGSYINSIEKPTTTPSKPVISFSPALLLRKRNTRSFTALYEKILENIENSGDEIDIPTINDLIGFPEIVESDSSNTETSSNQSETEPIFFPKEYNDEQIEIVEKTRRKNKVLVQGPPGTGKSHTIANLICHLLANGKKILVTAYTKRALEVLKDKLPNEFKNLVVNLLSGDSASIKDLQGSVNSINDELSRANLIDYQVQIDDLEKDLNSVRERIAESTNDLIKIKEKATRQQQINAAYSGTLTEIAEVLEIASVKYNWYNDTFSDINYDQIHLDLIRFIELSKIFNQEIVSELEYIIPDSNNLPSFEQIKECKQINNELSENYESNNHIIINCPDFDRLKTKLLELNHLYSQAYRLQIDFTQYLLSSYLQGDAFNWKQKLDTTSSVLNRIEKLDLKKIDKDIEVLYPSGKSIKQLKNDGQILLKHLKKGNQLSGISFSLKKSFLPTEVKERLYFIDGIKVNGSPCDTVQEFEIVLQDISLKQDLVEISELWNKEIPTENSYFRKFNYFKNIHSEVTKLLEIIDQSEVLRLEIEKLSSLIITPFDKEKLAYLIKETDYNHLLVKIKNSKDLINKAEVYLRKETLHPIKEKLCNCFNHIDCETYKETLSELNNLFNKKNEFISFNNLKANLETQIPYLLNSIIAEDFSDKNLLNLREAIFFRNAQNEIKRILDIDYELQLINDLTQLEQKKLKVIAKLASKKAWYRVIEGLQQNRSLRQHLDAWVMAERKIGKTGKGKRAMKFRRIAQQEMMHCKDAVPCWIMPLYKVAETIQPEQNMYDYVIIDEASQLGPDAIFLLYITKNIIIVGDDKQTSPEYVGVNANAMLPHIKNHLKGIPRSEFFGTEFSFYDHARFFCDGVTVLREHFRCMPEIIEFSNKHFYAPEGNQLYPLKQYSEKRLEPLVSVFCSNGYTEGTGARIINEPEANRIAETIARIIEDGRYKDKTFGVITLQGNQQFNIIEGLLLKRIGEQEYHKRKIICGNSASFQGDERDIIFLSLVTAHNHNRSALVKPEDERRFNVAVSRAKEQIWLFHSVELDDLGNANDLRFKLLDHFKNYNSRQPILNTPIKRSLGTQPDPFDSWFEVDVYNDIVRRDLSVIPQYEVAKGKYRIDLVALFPDGTKIAIECDGDKWHGPEQYQNDLMRQKVLERCGWQFLRVRGYEYYTNREKALQPLWEMIPKIETKSNIATDPKEFVEESKIIVNSSGSNLIAPLSEIYDTQLFYNQSENYSPETKESSFKQSVPEIIRYFNLYNSGCYIMTDEKPLEADFVLPIKSNERNGYLLQCYESGHINKVIVSVLLSRKIGKEYMNGLDKSGKLIYLKIIESEKIIGIFFTENGRRKFKAHLTENISKRELLQLQGYKIMYNDFEKIEYKILPLEILNDIKRLVFQSFTANGKPIDNNYYENEWLIIGKFVPKEPAAKYNFEEKIVSEDKSLKTTHFEQEVSLHSTVKIKYLKNEKELSVHLVDFETKGFEVSYGIQKIYIHSPLALSILGKTTGDKVKILNTDTFIEILEIK